MPPFGAVQCVEGPHTRGTPPNVVETDPATSARPRPRVDDLGRRGRPRDGVGPRRTSPDRSRSSTCLAGVENDGPTGCTRIVDDPHVTQSAAVDGEVSAWSGRTGHPRRSTWSGRVRPGSTTTGSAARTTSPSTGRWRTGRGDHARAATHRQPPGVPAPGGALAADAGVRQFLDLGSGIPTRRQRARDRPGRPTRRARASTSTSTRSRSRTAGPAGRQPGAHVLQADVRDPRPCSTRPSARPARLRRADRGADGRAAALRGRRPTIPGHARPATAAWRPAATWRLARRDEEGEEHGGLAATGPVRPQRHPDDLPHPARVHRALRGLDAGRARCGAAPAWRPSRRTTSTTPSRRSASDGPGKSTAPATGRMLRVRGADIERTGGRAERVHRSASTSRTRLAAARSWATR